MATHYRACCCLIASCLLSFLCLPASPLEAASTLESPRFFSFQLHLQSPPRTPLNLQQHNTRSQPFSPHLFSAQPLFRFDESSHALISVGNARGLYLARSADLTDPCYLFFTASLQKIQGADIASTKHGENDKGSLVLMGSLSSGAISVIGGTGAFAFANGQAKVSIAAVASEKLIMSFDVELQQEDSEFAVL